MCDCFNCGKEIRKWGAYMTIVRHTWVEDDGTTKALKIGLTVEPLCDSCRRYKGLDAI